MNNKELCNAINDILKENNGLFTVAEPEIGNPADIIINCFQNEQKSKTSFQPWLILGLMIFLIIQLLYTNHLYDTSIMKLLSINEIDKELAVNFFDLYNNILSQLKFYTTAVLCEFIAVFCFIVRWGFDSKVSDMFSDLFKNKPKNTKKKGSKQTSNA